MSDKESDHYLKQELYNLIQSDARLIDFLEAGSLDGLWYWDLESPEHEWMSPNFWKTLGYDPAEKKPLVSEWQTLIFPEDLELAVANFQAHCKDPNHPYDQVVRYKHKDGSTVWVRCRGIAIRDESGKPIRLLGAHNDITEQKRAAENLKQLNKELEYRVNERTALLKASNRELEAFCYSVSHDLRAPLRHILGFMKLFRAEDNQLTEEGKRYLNIIESAAERSGRLIDDLLQYSRVGRFVIKKRMIILNDLVDELFEEHTLNNRGRNIEFSRETLPLVFGDESLLRSVLSELLSNAIKFTVTREHAVIKISGTETSDKTTIHVTDNGIGFDPNYTHKVFEIFQRLHKVSEYEGTGIGLANVARSITRHGGVVTAKSQPGEGTTISVSLPKQGKILTEEKESTDAKA